MCYGPENTDLFSMENTEGRSLGWVTEYGYQVHEIMMRELREEEESG